ncbi:ASST-domain-containing protein [Penicillium atrosanguineum]|nr:ASST-domain-containing protein [Penicillium atrosanguineum]
MNIDEHCSHVITSVIILGIIFTITCAADAATWISFQSVMVLRQRPDIHAPILDVSTNNEQSVTPGFIFLAPYETALPGPYI